jgi:hypothetical protein
MRHLKEQGVSLETAIENLSVSDKPTEKKVGEENKSDEKSE